MPGVNASGNQDTSGNATTATTATNSTNVTVTDNENTNNEIAWCVTVIDKSINSTVCSESLPEAICRVALEALDKRSKA